MNQFLVAVTRRIKDIVFFPKAAFEVHILSPINRFRKKFLTVKGAQSRIGNPIANFVYGKSNEMPVVMLVFNAISILSSHFAQIHGLKNSDRENKDYLIEQEKSELGLDLALTIIPPFMLNRFLTKKLDSGVLTSKSARAKLCNEIAPTLGAWRTDLYNTDHIIPIKDSIKNSKDSMLRSLKSNPKIPFNLRKKIRVKPLDVNERLPAVTMEKVTLDFDRIHKGKYEGFYNGRAYDEIIGQRNGVLIIAGICYTILASNIIMPILKNKLTSKRYKKELEASGETPDSIKRKKRYNKLADISKFQNNESVFSIFSNSDNSTTTTKVVDRSIYNNLLSEQIDNKNIFDDINMFSRSQFQPNGLKI